MGEREVAVQELGGVGLKKNTKHAMEEISMKAQPGKKCDSPYRGSRRRKTAPNNKKMWQAQDFK